MVAGMRLKIIPAHSGCRTVFYLVDADAPLKDQPDVKSTHHSLDDAMRAVVKKPLTKRQRRSQ